MKKPAKISLGIVIIIAILFFFGLRTPLIVNGNIRHTRTYTSYGPIVPPRSLLDQAI